MWYSRKNLVDEFNNNPEQFLRCFGLLTVICFLSFPT